jgi:hypothetical protein
VKMVGPILLRVWVPAVGVWHSRGHVCGGLHCSHIFPAVSCYISVQKRSFYDHLRCIVGARKTIAGGGHQWCPLAPRPCSFSSTPCSISSSWSRTCL